VPILKLVIILKGVSLTMNIEERDLDDVLTYINRTYEGKNMDPLSGELFRRKIKDGVIVIYKKNRHERTRSEWLEYRGLFAVSKLLDMGFLHSVVFNINGIQREIDGVNFGEKTMVEVHWGVLDESWLKYYLKKKKILGFKRCIILARETSPDIPKNHAEIYIFRPDQDSIERYYSQYSFPAWIVDHLAKRHIRILTHKGQWVGLRRRLSKTPKYSPEEKFRIEIRGLLKRGIYPIKLYYSIARMVNPIAEYYGRGHPLPYVIGVLDVDVSDKNVPIHYKYYVEMIKKNLEEKIRHIKMYLESLGYNTRILFSGKKGYHIYICDPSDGIEFRVEEIEEIISALGRLVDNYNFRDKTGRYDLHRIVKMPYTIDQTTGLTVTEKPRRVPNDAIYRYGE